VLLEKVLVCLGSPLMLNGKLKSHFELWDALLQVEKMFDTMDDEVSIMPKVFLIVVCLSVCDCTTTNARTVRHRKSL